VSELPSLVSQSLATGLAIAQLGCERVADGQLISEYNII
jgi:hypothetical protein